GREFLQARQPADVAFAVSAVGVAQDGHPGEGSPHRRQELPVPAGLDLDLEPFVARLDRAPGQPERRLQAVLHPDLRPGSDRPQLHDQLGPVADPLPSILKLELERDADEPQDDAVDLHACQKAPVADAPVPMAIPWADSWETPRMMDPPRRSSMTKTPQFSTVGSSETT